MTITLAEMHSNTVEIFHNSASFLQELSDTDSMSIHGGKTNISSKDSNCQRKLLEYKMIQCAISNIMSLVKLCIDTPQRRSQDSISSSQKLQISILFKQCDSV